MHKGTIHISSIYQNPWLRQFPQGEPVWDGWRFVFNAENQPCDWLVVFENPHAPIALHCPPGHTIHLAAEPPDSWQYSQAFLKQFTWIITQDKKAAHPRKIHTQSGLSWHIGWNQKMDPENCKAALDFKTLKHLFDAPKTKLIAVIASSKKLMPGHVQRLHFIEKLKAHYGSQMDFYGRGFVNMEDKLDALRDYRFHIVLENSNIDDYFSEKFTDCVIAGAYPLYWGCTNLESYFPEKSFAQIDINHFEQAVQTIDRAIAEEWDQRYRQQLRQARDLSMNRYNIFPMLVDLIANIHAGKYENARAPLPANKTIIPFAQPKPRVFFMDYLSRMANQNAFWNGMRQHYRTLKKILQKKSMI